MADKINRDILKATEDYYNEIGKLENLVAKNKYEKKSIIYSDTKSKQTEEKKPCQVCVNEKKEKKVIILRKIAGLKRKTKKPF